MRANSACTRYVILICGICANTNSDRTSYMWAVSDILHILHLSRKQMIPWMNTRPDVAFVVKIYFDLRKGHTLDAIVMRPTLADSNLNFTRNKKFNVNSSTQKWYKYYVKELTDNKRVGYFIKQMLRKILHT